MTRSRARAKPLPQACSDRPWRKSRRYRGCGVAEYRRYPSSECRRAKAGLRHCVGGCEPSNGSTRIGDMLRELLVGPHLSRSACRTVQRGARISPGSMSPAARHAGRRHLHHRSQLATGGYRHDAPWSPPGGSCLHASRYLRDEAKPVCRMVRTDRRIEAIVRSRPLRAPPVATPNANGLRVVWLPTVGRPGRPRRCGTAGSSRSPRPSLGWCRRSSLAPRQEQSIGSWRPKSSRG